MLSQISRITDPMTEQMISQREFRTLRATFETYTDAFATRKQKEDALVGLTVSGVDLIPAVGWDIDRVRSDGKNQSRRSLKDALRTYHQLARLLYIHEQRLLGTRREREVGSWWCGVSYIFCY